MQNYKEKRQEAYKICKKKKQRAMKDKITDIETHRRQNNNLRDFYRCVKQLNRGYQPRLAACKDENGCVITEEELKVCRWKQYFENLLIVQRNDNMLSMEIDDKQCLSLPEINDTEEAIMKLKNNKAPGENLITAELYKCGGEILLKELHKLICRIWRDEEMASAWKTSIISPIYKKGDKLTCSNYRGIALLDVAYKILSEIVGGML